MHNGSDIAPTASDDFHIGVPKEVAAYRRRADENGKWHRLTADRLKAAEAKLAAADAVVAAAERLEPAGLQGDRSYLTHGDDLVRLREALAEYDLLQARSQDSEK